MTGARSWSAGYVLCSHHRRQSRAEKYVKEKNEYPCGFRLKSSTLLTTKESIYLKEFSAIYLEFLRFAQTLWEATKPTIVQTDIKPVTGFSQTKTIPPSLWNACHYVLQVSNLKLQRRSSSKSGKTNKQHQFMWQHLLRMTQIRTNISSHKPTKKLRP